MALGSATLSSASPAVETTFAVVDAEYSRATPGVNAPNCAGGPSVSESVAGTVPPTPPGTWVTEPVSKTCSSLTPTPNVPGAGDQHAQRAASSRPGTSTLL